MIVYRIVRLYEYRNKTEPEPSGYYDRIREPNGHPTKFVLSLEQAIEKGLFEYNSGRSSYFNTVSGAKQGRTQILKWERDDIEEEYPIVSFELVNPTLVE